MHVLEDSAIFATINNATKENDGRGRVRRTRLRLLYIASVSVLFLICVAMLHGMMSSLESEGNTNTIETNHDGGRNNNVAEQAVVDVVKSKVINAVTGGGETNGGGGGVKRVEEMINNQVFDTDEGILIDFYVTNLDGGNPDEIDVFTVQTKPSWSQLGAERFEELTLDNFWNDCIFFRAIKNFIVQWGISGDKKMNDKWSTPIHDEGVKESNARGTMSFAMEGPGTRGHQMFINTKNNQSLDSQGFVAVGKVVKGMDVVDRIYSGYGEKPKQNMIQSSGNKYLNDLYPKLSYIVKAVPRS